MQRQDISRLSHNRNIYLKLGFLVAIGISILAFQWEVDATDNQNYEIIDTGNEEIEVLTPRTPPDKKVIPLPPVIKAVTTEIEDIDVVIDPEPVLDKVEITQDVDSEPVITNNYVKPAIIEKILIRPEIKEPEVDLAPIDFAEQMPRFPGCEEEGLSDKAIKECAQIAFFTFLKKELKYPEMARETGVRGTVVLQFVVNEDGSLSDMEILKNLGAGCGRESLRVGKKMPNWIPGKQRGQPVKVRMRLPIKFKLLD